MIPAGTEVSYHSYDIHRDPNFWEEPNKFDPDRFLPERSQGRHPFSYIPFSAGPRNCIGNSYLFFIACHIYEGSNFINT